MTLESVLVFIGSRQFAMSMSVFIVLFGAFWLINYCKKIIPIYRQIREMLELLKTTKGEAEFRKNFERLDKHFRESSVLGHAWHEFSESLLSTEESVKNAKEAGHYFNHDTLLLRNINLTLYEAIPNILTGFGILGTFLGLLSGISQVSVQHINTIERLLGGAAVAFSTSIAGLLSSIIFTLILKRYTFATDILIQNWVEGLDKRLEWISPEKIQYNLFLQQLKQSEILESFAEKIGGSIYDAVSEDNQSEFVVLKEIRDEIKNFNISELQPVMEEQTATITSNFETLRKDLTKYNNNINETAMKNITDIKEVLEDRLSLELDMLVEIRDRFSETRWQDLFSKIDQVDHSTRQAITSLGKSFDDFKQHMKDNYSRTMIEALENVIQDFNVKITDQFGDNFKELNKAVGNLLIWQDNYLKTLETMQKNLSKQLEENKQSSKILSEQSQTIEKITHNIRLVEESLSQLSLTTDDIIQQMKVINEQNQTLNAFIISVKNVGDEAKKVLPSISQNIESHVDVLSKTIDDTSIKIEKSYSGISNLTDELTEKMRLMVDENSKQVDNTLDMLKQNLEKTLNESLTTLAGHLAALSGRFVKDYTPLTEKLRDILTISESITLDKKQKN